jgi:hypothetical protein
VSIKLTCSCGKRFQVDERHAGKSAKCPGCGKALKIVAESPSPYDVFLSYSSQDQAMADAACGVLETRGLRCWMAPRNILAGKEWSAAIIEGIEQSRSFVLVFSANANQSRQVLREVERAVAKGIPILPLRVQDLKPSKGLEYFISSQHWQDALTPPLESHLERLAETVKRLLGEAATPPPIAASRPVTPPLAPTPPARRWRIPRTALAALGTVAVIVCAVIVWSQLKGSSGVFGGRASPLKDFREDFSAVKDGALPAGWSADEGISVQRGSERAHLEVLGKGQHNVQLPAMTIAGDFFMECEFFLDFTESNVEFQFQGKNGTPDLVVKVKDGNGWGQVLSVTLPGQEPQLSKKPPEVVQRFRFRLERRGTRIAVLVNDEAVTAHLMPDLRDFDRLRLSLPGHKSTRFYSIRMGSLASAL